MNESGSGPVFHKALAKIFEGIADLTAAFPRKCFTIDGRLVGDLGEVIAELEYELSLYEKQRPIHDAYTPDGRQVQIKATFKDTLSLTAVPDYYLGLRLEQDGTFNEVFNGPGNYIAERFGHRKGFGEKQLSFSIEQLVAISKTIPEAMRIKKRSTKPNII